VKWGILYGKPFFLLDGRWALPVEVMGTTPATIAFPKGDFPNGRPPQDIGLLYERFLPTLRQLSPCGCCESHFRCRRRHSRQPNRDLVGLATTSLLFVDPDELISTESACFLGIQLDLDKTGRLRIEDGFSRKRHLPLDIFEKSGLVNWQQPITS
jgi:hypothetical protein